MNEQYELYYNDGHGWQPSNLGRFDTRDEAEDAKGSWTDGFTRANGAAPQVRVDRAGVLRFGAGAVAPGELAALRACAEALKECIKRVSYRGLAGDPACCKAFVEHAKQALAALDAAKGQTKQQGGK